METAVIAGIGPGFVESLAWNLAQEGNELVLFARSEEYIREVAAEMRECGHEAIGVPTDITDEAQVERGFERARDEFGPVDSLAVTASAEAGWGRLDDLSIEDFRKAWDVYGLGTFLCARAAAADMRETGDGTILVVGVPAGYAEGRAHGYASAKGAKRALTRSLASELAPAVHVVHVEIDGFILNPDIRELFDPDPDDDRFIDPDAAADVCTSVIERDEGAWSSSIDLRAPNYALAELLDEFE